MGDERGNASDFEQTRNRSGGGWQRPLHQLHNGKILSEIQENLLDFTFE
ncbi:hypothetical protein [Polaromonas sp. SM01]|nr:hypothetical protein [Polaromonas sp. SM01]MDW5441816.1 hypothetical protein [Polaromonas sp. SM01]